MATRCGCVQSDCKEKCTTKKSGSTGSTRLKAASALKKLLISKQVTVFSKRFDDYGREVAKITADNMDAGGWMVQNGHAWSYHYRFSAGPYRPEEDAAKRARLGLFADASAVEPKIFRREHGSCYPAKNDRKRYK